MTNQASFPIDLKALALKLGTSPSLRIVPGKRLSGGLSGAEIWQVELHPGPEQFSYAVIKLASANRPDDLRDEEAGRRSLEATGHYGPWLPEACTRVAEFHEGRDVLVTSYAEPTSTSVDTLDDLLLHQFDRSLVVLEKIGEMAKTLVEVGQTQSAERAEHLHAALGPQLAKKLTQSLTQGGFDAIVAEPGQPRIRIQSSVLPNPLACLTSSAAWKTGTTSIPSQVLHGDLNCKNLIVAESNRHILIDFEKTRRGPALYDVAFLLMWMAKHLVLDATPDDDASRGALLQLAIDVGRSLQRGERPSCREAAHKPFLLALEKLWTPLRLLLAASDTDQHPRQARQDCLVYSIAAAALARSYYECRDVVTQRQRQHPERGRRDAQFYLALAASVLDGSLLEQASEHAATSLLPLTKPVARPHAEALRLQLRGAKQPARSFATKLIFRVALPPGWERVATSAWRFAQVEEYKYLSKLRMSDLRAATRDVLCWRDDGARLDATGYPVPDILEHDLSRIIPTGQRQICIKKAPILRLDHVDLVPMSNGEGFIGLEFIGEATSLSGFLEWASQRTLYKLPIAAAGSARPLTIGDVLRNLVSSLSPSSAQERREDAPQNFSPFGSIHYALLDGSPWPSLAQWQSAETPPGLALAMAATNSRPNKNYPKTDDIQIWGHREALDTVHALAPCGFTVFASNAQTFNDEVKRHVVMRANYLQWLVAGQLVERGVEATTYINSHDPAATLRRAFAMHCLEHFRRRRGR